MRVYSGARNLACRFDQPYARLALCCPNRRHFQRIWTCVSCWMVEIAWRGLWRGHRRRWMLHRQMCLDLLLRLLHRRKNLTIHELEAGYASSIHGFVPHCPRTSHPENHFPRWRSQNLQLRLLRPNPLLLVLVSASQHQQLYVS